MRPRVGLGAALLVAGMALAATAAELSPNLRTLIEHFQAHRRVALGYLLANDPDLGAIALERLRSDWAADRGKLKAGEPALRQALAATEAAVAASLKAIDAGEMNEARTLLARAAAPLDDWRHIHGIGLFSDCITEFGAVYRRLDAHRATTPDLDNEQIRGQILAEVTDTAAAAARCDREAPVAVHSEPEFRRLIDGLASSLRQVPEALRQRDNDYLHRLLDEERAFDRLLAFRFG